MRWLGEQLDEDERIARAARDAEFCKDGRWAAKGPFGEGLGGIHSEAGEAVLGEEENVPFAIADHAARHDPARVLREIDAKWQILRALQSAEVALRNTEPGKEPHELMTGSTNSLRAAVRMIATAYADRPGYREDWRP